MKKVRHVRALPDGPMVVTSGLMEDIDFPIVILDLIWIDHWGRKWVSKKNPDGTFQKPKKLEDTP